MEIKIAKYLRATAEKEIKVILEQLLTETKLRIHNVDVEFIDTSTTTEDMSIVSTVKITMKI